MTSTTSSKAIPFIVLALVGGFMAVDMFTPYHITDEMLQMATIILTPIGVGGIFKKAIEVYQETRSVL